MDMAAEEKLYGSSCRCRIPKQEPLAAANHVMESHCSLAAADDKLPYVQPQYPLTSSFEPLQNQPAA